MSGLLAKMLLLFAVVLMPLGMQPAAAASDVRQMASMPMQHCSEQAPTHHSKPGFVQCTMACSSALPAADASQTEPGPIIDAPTAAAVTPLLQGLQPDTATPPPKHS